MLKDLNDCLYEAVNEDCTDECLKDVTEDLTGLKEVDVVIFNLKSFLNEYATNASLSASFTLCSLTAFFCHSSVSSEICTI